MKLSYIAALAFLSFLFFSCQKEISYTDNTDPTNLPGNTLTTRLTKIYALDTTLAAPHDTTYRESYLYDASNRLSQKITLQTDANGDSVTYKVKTYIYNGSDTFASMVASKGRSFSTPGGPGYNSKDTAFYVYNAAGEQLRDSDRVSANSYYKTDYTHLSSSYITGKYHQQYPSLTYYNGDYSYHPVQMNGNIVSQKDTNSIIAYGFAGPDTTYFAYNRSATYNQHPDPLGHVTVFTKKDFFNGVPSLGNLSSPINLLISEDITSTRFTRLSPPEAYMNYHVDYTYVYRSDGYPLIAREHLVQIDIAGTSGTTVSYTKILFVY